MRESLNRMLMVAIGKLELGTRQLVPPVWMAAGVSLGWMARMERGVSLSYGMQLLWSW